MFSTKQSLFVIGFTIGGLVMAACGGAVATTPAVPAATAPATQTSGESMSGQVTVSAADSALGSILVDGRGMTLYLLTGDSADASICTDACATAWPPLAVSGSATAGTGVDAAKLGTISRPDGISQVTYNGHPLYGFVKDKAAGDVNGQGIDKFGGIWYVVSPSGDAITQSMSSGATGGGNSAGVELATADSSFGKILVDGQGMSLYLLTADSADQSACTDACASAWPPLASTGQVSAVSGAEASLLGTLTRPDGSTQVTYNGHPLDSFKGDHAAGDIAGQGIQSFGGTWYLLSPAGEQIEASANSDSPAQPTSSYSPY
jgi:predicted lipoprotein with Yx(FWY)xxD motif